MTSEDLRVVLLAAITMVGGSIALWIGVKMQQVAASTKETAASTASTAVSAQETLGHSMAIHQAVNSERTLMLVRLEEMSQRNADQAAMISRLVEEQRAASLAQLGGRRTTDPTATGDVHIVTPEVHIAAPPADPVVVDDESPRHR